MARPEKEALIKELLEEVQQAAGLLLTDYRGLTVKQMSRLRQALRPQGASYRVVKNTLFRRALEACGQSDLGVLVEGPTAVAFLSGEPSAVVKELLAFAKASGDRPSLKGGLVEGRVLPSAEVAALATLPPREQLLAALLGLLQAPLANLVATLRAGPARLASLLQALAEKKAEAGAPA